MPTSTQLPGLTSGISPIAGSIGEQIKSAIASTSSVAITTGATVNLTSLSLTAGIWDLDYVGQFNFSAPANGDYGIIAISTTSATLPASSTGGDSRVSQPVNTGTVVPICATISGFRVVLSGAATYYAVAFATLAGGTCAIYGRISATRVG